MEIDININGLEKLEQIANDLSESVEKTKALAGGMVKACDELNITLDREAVAQAAVKAIDAKAMRDSARVNLQLLHEQPKYVENDSTNEQEDEIRITPLGIALGIALEMGIISKEDPDVLVKFRNYWEKVEKYVLPYAFEQMKAGEADHVNAPPNSQ